MVKIRFDGGRGVEVGLGKKVKAKRLRTDSNRNQLLSDGVGGSHSTLELQRLAFQLRPKKIGF